MRTFDLIDAAVTTLRATSGFCAPGGTGTPVFDGPVVSLDQLNLFVVIGGAGLADDDDADDTAATFDTEWWTVPIGAGSRHETCDVPCAIVATAGDGEWATLRGQVSDAIDAIGGALITRTAWNSVSQVESVTLTNFALKQTTYADAFAVSLAFDLSASFLL